MKSIQIETSRAPLPESQEVQAFLGLGKRQDWAFAVLGLAPMPSEPIQLQNWKIVPAHLDSSPIPDRAMERIREIYSSGLRPKGFVVVHETPNALPSVVPDFVEGEFIEVRPGLAIDVTSIIETGLMLGSAAAKIAASAVFAIGSVVLPAIFLLGSALLVDPILIVVTEDDVWIEIDRWFE